MAATRDSLSCKLDLLSLWILGRCPDNGDSVSPVMFVLWIGDVVERELGCSFWDVCCISRDCGATVEGEL